MAGESKMFFSGLDISFLLDKYGLHFQTESELHEDSGQSSIYTQCFVWIKSAKPGRK